MKAKWECNEYPYFYCLDADDGDVEWRRRVGGANVGRPAIDAERVYCAAMDNVIRIVDRVDGALKWQAGIAFQRSAGPTLFGTAVVVPSAAQELRTFDIRTGKAGRTISFGSELAGLDLRWSEQGPIAATITGGLSAEWKLSFWEPLMAIPIGPSPCCQGSRCRSSRRRLAPVRDLLLDRGREPADALADALGRRRRKRQANDVCAARPVCGLAYVERLAGDVDDLVLDTRSWRPGKVPVGPMLRVPRTV